MVNIFKETIALHDKKCTYTLQKRLDYTDGHQLTNDVQNELMM